MPILQKRDEVALFSLHDDSASQANRDRTISGVFEGIGVGVDEASSVDAEVGSFIIHTGMAVEVAMYMRLLKEFDVLSGGELT